MIWVTLPLLDLGMNKIATNSYIPIETGSSSDKYVLSIDINSASELRADFNLRRTLQIPTKNIHWCSVKEFY